MKCELVDLRVENVFERVAHEPIHRTRQGNVLQRDLGGLTQRSGVKPGSGVTQRSGLWRDIDGSLNGVGVRRGGVSLCSLDLFLVALQEGRPSPPAAPPIQLMDLLGRQVRSAFNEEENEVTYCFAF